MTVHLVKLAAGIRDPAVLRARMQARAAAGGATARIVTGNYPKRHEELLDGGSLYWVTGGRICLRQPIKAIEEAVKPDGRKACALMLDAGGIVEVRPTPRSAFQGWRYLETKDAPPDLTPVGETGELPPAMIAELRSLGLL